MRYKNPIIPPNEGDVKNVIRFAWRKTQVSGFLLQFERYEVRYVWAVQTLLINFNGEKKAAPIGSWIEVQKNIID